MLVFSLAGKPDEAEKLGLRALSIVEKAYGPVHPEIATCLNNLSALLHARRSARAYGGGGGGA